MNARLAPIVKSVDLACPAADAFRMFTEHMGAWWPLDTHARADAAAGQRAEAVTVEPRVGGRIYETLGDGARLDWGEVLAWQPGARLEMSWHLGRPREQSTRISVSFEPRGAASCRVTLVHSDWERLGEDADARRRSYDQGWVAVFEQRFAEYARGHATAVPGRPA